MHKKLRPILPMCRELESCNWGARIVERPNCDKVRA